MPPPRTPRMAMFGEDAGDVSVFPFFFFSSRRRHTRLQGDWSSDVCSSDLYHGGSSYLLFCKYNNYAFSDGNGINRVALLDPNSTQLDPHSSAPNFAEMREVLDRKSTRLNSSHLVISYAVFCLKTKKTQTTA